MMCRRRGVLGAALLFVMAAFATGAPAPARAQTETGYELSLHGSPQATYGGTLRMSGTAYVVRGLAALAPLSGGDIRAELRRYSSDRRGYETVREVRVESDREGHFAFLLDVPEERIDRPQLRVHVGPSASGGRSFDWSIQLRSATRIDLLTDRARYETDETMHIWARVVHGSTDRPLRGRRIRVRVTDPANRQVAERELTTGPSGATTMDVPISASAQDGHYRIQVATVDHISAATTQRSVRVGRRTVERLLVNARLDQRVVPPGGELTGEVTVRTPSGAPVLGADVQLQVGSNTTALTTDGEGIARFRVQAPAFLSGDVAHQSISVRVQHGAHGTLHIGAPYLLSRVEWRIEASAENGALVPEVPTRAWLSVTNAFGEPAPEGTEVDVEGPAVERGRAHVTVDAHGLAAVPMRVGAGDAGPLRTGGAGCNGQYGTRLTATIHMDNDIQAKACVRVARHALVRPRMVAPTATPGAEALVEVARHPDARGQAILLEAIVDRRTVASAWIGRGQSRGALRLPEDVAGVLEIRARPATTHDRRFALSEPGGVSVGTGASSAVLVRPADAFSLEVDPEQDLYRVRERANIVLRTSGGPQQGWATLVARDLAAHGGETDYALSWLARSLSEAATNPMLDGADVLLRSALDAGLAEDPRARRPEPLIREPWQASAGGSQPQARGVLRDPIMLRDEKLRRGIGATMMRLEQVVLALGATLESRRGMVSTRGGRTIFDPEIIENLVARNQLSGTGTETLGGGRMSVSMLTAADPSFTFDRVAHRVARLRLLRLMLAISRFANPDDANAARASAGQPPARWLSRMVQLGAIPASELTDPWGRSYSFRRVGVGRARVVLTERAADFELASPGPDGRFGTRDDVRDPFERIVTAGTIYATASREDDLMRRLGVLAAGPTVLAAMAQAYDAISLEAREEGQGGLVSALASEGADGFGGLGLRGTGRGGGGMGEGTIGLGSLGTIGHGAGGSGSGYGRGARAERRARSRAPASPAAMADMAGPRPSEEEADDGDDRAAQSRQAPAPRLQVAGELIRERFPATLLFVGEIALEGSATIVPLELADALTTYRIEAIAWGASGWTTSARADVRVDQEATVDAPVPPFATVGDVVRVPIRVANRTESPLTARVEISGEGLSVDAPAPQTIEIPARDAVEVTVAVRMSALGEGALVARAVRVDGSPLDAVRRPLRVLPDARLVRTSHEVLLQDGHSIVVEVPADASERGAGELRVAAGATIFGDPEEWASLAAPWTLAMLGEDVPEALGVRARQALDWSHPEEDRRLHGAPLALAQAVAVTWSDAEVADSVIRRGLRTLSALLEADPAQSTPVNAGAIDQRSRVLLALAPAVRADGRGDARSELRALVSQLRRQVGNGAVRVADAHVTWVRAAAALANTGDGGDEPRALELLRRVRRHVIRVGDEAFLEPTQQAGIAYARVEPSSLVALAHIGLGDRAKALLFVRSVARLGRGAERWSVEQRALAAVAAGRLSSAPNGVVHARLDGAQVTLRSEAGVAIGVLEGVGRPGRHELSIELEGGGVALAWVDVRYGRPWSAEPARRVPLDLLLEGAIGSRDTRSGLALTLRNRGARIVGAPLVEVDMPAGVELDEPTRDALARYTVRPPTTEGRTLQLALRPLAPGGYQRIPLPLRWSVGGELRGLGATARDARAARDVEAVAVLASRALTVADEGAEPEEAEHDASPPPLPEPIPLPTPIERLVPRVGLLPAPSARIERGAHR